LTAAAQGAGAENATGELFAENEKEPEGIDQ